MRFVDDGSTRLRLTPAGFVVLARRARRAALASAKRSPRRFVRGLAYGFVRLMFAGGGLVIVGVLSILAGSIVLSIYEGPSGLWLLMFSPVAVSLIFSSMSIIRGMANGWVTLKQSMANAMLAEKRCPACGYSLAGIRAGPDGCTHCPECAAAWGTRRVGAESGVEPVVVVVR